MNPFPSLLEDGLVPNISNRVSGTPSEIADAQDTLTGSKATSLIERERKH